MEPRKAYEKIEEILLLEQKLSEKGRLEFGDPDFIRYKNLLHIMDQYMNSMGIADLKDWYQVCQDKEQLGKLKGTML